MRMRMKWSEPKPKKTKKNKKKQTSMFLTVLAFVLLAATCTNATDTATAATTTCVDYFMRPGCPYCARVTPVLTEMAQNSSLGLELRVHNVDRIYERRLFDAVYKKMQWDEQYGVPTLVVGETALVGDTKILDNLRQVLATSAGAQCMDERRLLGAAKEELSVLAVCLGAFLSLLQAISPLWVSAFTAVVAFVGSHHSVAETEVKMEDVETQRKHRNAHVEEEEDIEEEIEEESETLKSHKEDGNGNDDSDEDEKEGYGNSEKVNLVDGDSKPYDEEDDGLPKFLTGRDYASVTMYIVMVFLLNIAAGTAIWVLASLFVEDPYSETAQRLTYAVSGLVIVLGALLTVLSVAKVPSEGPVARAANRLKSAVAALLKKTSSCAGKGLACLVCAFVSCLTNAVWMLPTFFLFTLANLFRFGSSIAVIAFVAAAYSFVGVMFLAVLLVVAAASWRSFEKVSRVFSGRKGINVCSVVGVVYVVLGIMIILNESLFVLF